MVRVFVIEARERHLFEIVGTLGTPCRFAGGLNRRQKKSNQNSDDSNHHKKFDKGKTGSDSKSRLGSEFGTDKRVLGSVCSTFRIDSIGICNIGFYDAGGRTDYHPPPFCHFGHKVNFCIVFSPVWKNGLILFENISRKFNTD
jgi:hypothetical protein